MHLVGGKGGAGKTTCAAMFALAAPAAQRTLLVTTDPASSLSAVLDAPVGSEPAPLPGASHVHVANIEASPAFARWLAPRRALLAAIALRGTYLDEGDVARLLKLSLPGIDEVIGLLEVTQMAYGRYDAVIVDTAPTGHTLRLLASPALLGRVAGVLNALQSHHRAVVSALRGSYTADAADALITELDRAGDALAAKVRDLTATELTWVTLPEPMALEETSDAARLLAAEGLVVSRLIVNRLTPKPPERCSWCDGRRRFEARALMPLASRFPATPILGLPEFAVEPRGVAVLRGVARHLKPWVPPAAARPLEHRVRARAAGTGAVARPADVAGGKVRWILFGGKGGVGKSTCAATAALDLATADPARRILLLSSDPAHSLADVFGCPLGNEPQQVRGAPSNLLVREIDAAAEMDHFRRRYVGAVDDAFAGIARRAGGDHSAFRELIDLAPPGIDEVIAIADVAEAITDGEEDYGLIVTDTAPTGHALRLLQTPAVLRDWTQALMTILLKYREIVGAGTLASLLVQLSKRLRGLQGVLADPRQTRFVVVTRAAFLAGDESGALLNALHGLGIAVGAVIVNAAGAGDCRRCAGIVAAQRAEVARLQRVSSGRRPYAIIETPAEVPPPHGAAGLLAWGHAWRRIA